MGNWKNYDELEENLCVDELLLTVKAIYEKEGRHHKFMAALEGVDLEEESKVDPTENDITKLKGYQAAKAGFGIDQGLGYVVEE